MLGIQISVKQCSISLITISNIACWITVLLMSGLCLLCLVFCFQPAVSLAYSSSVTGPLLVKWVP